MEKMFCFQCQQTAKNIACNIAGICGKKADTANLQDELTGQIIGLAHAVRNNRAYKSTYEIIIDSLFMTITNVNFDNSIINQQIAKIKNEKARINSNSTHSPSLCSKNVSQNMDEIWNGDEDVRSLKSLILFGLRGMAAYAHHATVLGKSTKSVNDFFIKGLNAIGEDLTPEQLLDIVLELGNENLECMGLLDKANTEAYGTPVPTEVPCEIEKGPFVVITGHDLHDLKLLLEQTDGKNINVYTHSEMLPAHAYPELKKYSQLKGNFGTAWQNQQKEFDNIPAPILFTTNCLMPPKQSYADRVFTTSVVGYPEIKHISEKKDFSEVLAKAMELGGYIENHKKTGINGGETLLTGFGHNTVLSIVDTVIDAVKAGTIKHFFLVGGCDGAAIGRNYYTDFVKKTPKDSIILTLACGKYRFNDLNLGTIGGLPRIMDMGQCNDAYSAIQVVAALSKAFDCSVNDLPLTFVLSWYEQKAVCILLTLLALGIKNIYLGPTLPAFVSKNVLKILVDNYNIKPITTATEDLKVMLK